MKLNKQKNLYAKLLVLMIFIIFIKFIILKKIYVYEDAASDTFDSYWPIYNYLVQSIKKFTLNGWSFEIGIGTNIITLGSFLFDPFILLLIPFGKTTLPIGILIISMLKIFLSGFLFYNYLDQFKFSDPIKMFSTVIFTFNSYLIFWGQHYQFATMFLLFTFLLYSFEIYFNQHRKKWLYISIILLLINTLYFSYTIIIFMFFYVSLRYFLSCEKIELKNYLRYIFKLIKIFVFSFLISAPVTLPMLYLLLNSARTQKINTNIPLFGTKVEYMTLILKFFSSVILKINDYPGSLNVFESANIYTSVLVLLLLPQLFFILNKRREKYTAFLLTLLSISLLIFPFFSYFFNKFSLYTYRWTFILIPIIILGFSYILQNMEINKSINCKVLLGTVLIYIVLLITALLFFKPNNLDFKMFIFTIIILILDSILLLIWIKKNGNRKIQKILFIIVIIELLFTNFMLVNKRNIVDRKYITNKEGYFDETNEVITYITKQDKSFYRVDKDYYSKFSNDSLMQNYRGLKSYNSLNSPGYLDFYLMMENPLLLEGNVINGFDSNNNVKSLLGVKYQLNKTNGNPYGYKKIKEFGKVTLYENEYDLPLGFMYNENIGIDEFSKLTLEDKNEVLLSHVVLDTIEHKNIKPFSKYRVLNNLIFTGEMTEVNEENQVIFLTPVSEKYIFKISNLGETENLNLKFKITCTSQDKISLYIEKENNEKQLIKEIYLKYGENIENLNLDFQNIKNIEFNIEGNNKEGLQINELVVSEKDYSSYTEKIQKLKEQPFLIEKFSNSHIKGNIKVQKDGYLFFSIPYDKGWKIKVNGEERKTEKVNVGFLGVELKTGDYEIELIYKVPFLNLGIILMLVGLVCILADYLLSSKNKKNKDLR
jgi:uncharacterized membrane protein YfhO